MDIILIPGLWLTGSTWDQVLPALEGAGHRVHPLTLPGMGSQDAPRADIGLDDQVAAVVEAIDGCPDGGIVLVGHSAGSGIAYAAVDRRADRIARVIFVGGFPTPDGEPVAGGFPTDGADIPFPEWDSFDPADLGGMTDEALAAFRAATVPAPARLTTDLQRLADDRRLGVPATVVCSEFSSEMLVDWMGRDLAPVREMARLRHIDYVDLPTGHWPQLTRPEDLATVIVERAYEPHIDEHGRVHPPAGNEKATTIGFLEYQRATLEWKARGLTSAGLNSILAPSRLTLGGLLKHMAWVEDHWFSYWLHGRERSEPWNSVDWSADQDWEFTSSVDDTPAELLEMWKASVVRSRSLVAAAIAEGGLGYRAQRMGADGESVNLRWILLHMIEEYARHNGHADLLRESVDGETGE